MKTVLKEKLETADAFDLIESEIQSLSADKVAEAIRKFEDEGNLSFIKMGALFSRAQIEGWYSPDYPTFKEYVESFGVHYRRAMYWIDIYNNLINVGMPWSAVAHLGWTKLKEIAPHMTSENWEEWVKIAEERTVLQIQEYIKAMKSKKSGAGDEEVAEETNKLTTMTFKVHEDQKEIIRAAIDKAKDERGTEYDAVALEAICMEYLQGNVPSLKEMIASVDPETVLTLFGEVYPDVDITVTL
jgi:hypothetical protein